MKNKLVLASVVVAAILLAGCATLKPPNTDADVTAIRQIWMSYATAAEKGDAAAWLQLWDAGGIQLRPNAPARTREELVAQVPGQWKSLHDVSDMKMAINPIEVTVNGPWAYSRGLYTQDLTNKSTGGVTHVDGKFLTILKLQQDGTWRIYRDCFNSNVPPA